MSLVTAALAKALINTSLSDANLQMVIDRVEAQIDAQIGAPWSDDVTPAEVVKAMRGDGACLFLPTEIHSVVSIVEGDTTLDASDYEVWGGGVIERMPLDSNWGSRCVVTYQPADDRMKRTQVIIDLVRMVIERTAMMSESVAGEYSYTAPDNWEADFRRAMKRLKFHAL